MEGIAQSDEGRPIPTARELDRDLERPVEAGAEAVREQVVRLAGCLAGGVVAGVAGAEAQAECRCGEREQDCRGRERGPGGAALDERDPAGPEARAGLARAGAAAAADAVPDERQQGGEQGERGGEHE